MNTHDDRVDEQRPEIFSLWNTIRRQPHWKCLVISVLIYGCLGAIAWCRLTEVTKHVLNFSRFPITITKKTSPCDEGYVYIPLAFLVTLYLVYLVECWHCTVRLDMNSRIHVTDAQSRVEAMRDASPFVWWKAICYHYVRRTRQVTRYRNGDAYTTIQVYYERVNSHTSSSCFEYSQCGVRDLSKRLIDLDKFAVTRLGLSKSFAFANQEAALEFEEQRARFFQQHENQDDYMEMREGLDLLNVNFKETALAFAEPLPWYLSQTAFWLASAFLLSWPLRLLLATKTAHANYQIIKLFGINYGDTTLSLSPSSPCTVDLEWNITSNSALVPSYSEALLLDAPRPVQLPRPNSSDNVQSRSQSQSQSQTRLSTECRGPRHSWSASSARWARVRGLPSSNTRLSLHERIFYHAAPLFNRDGGGKTTDSPPSYDVAIRVCRPLAALAATTASELGHVVDCQNETAL